MEYAVAAFHDKVYAAPRAQQQDHHRTSRRRRVDAGHSRAHSAQDESCCGADPCGGGGARRDACRAQAGGRDAARARARPRRRWQVAETYDAGATWQHGDGSLLPAALVVAETAAKAAVEAQDPRRLRHDCAGLEAAAASSWACAVTVGWLITFTEKHGCWEWPTWRVVRDIVKPETAELRCRYAELPSVRASGAVGQATTFVAHVGRAVGHARLGARGRRRRPRAPCLDRHLRDPAVAGQRRRPRLRRRRQPV